MNAKTYTMKKLSSIFLIVVLSAVAAFGQPLSQTIRGTITDADSKLPLVGATVFVMESDPVKGTISDTDGQFRLERVPVGRIALRISYIGYEPRTILNVVVNSGKEVVLEVSLQESLITMEEVVVKPTRENAAPVNEMALVSARSVTPEQTQRYAGSMNDPSRILSNFAGVTNTQDGSNDIIVRGNSPKYIQWRLEGVEITNPNHFEDQNSSAGGVCALNNNLLAASDFYTGAFSPEYGNVLSGVYDVKLRSGNNEKFESTFGFGILGTDFTVEGPFAKGYDGSYLLNYRYSTIALIQDVGLTTLDGVLKYQDATFKVDLPTRKYGRFSIFGLFGLNGYALTNVEGSEGKIPGDRDMDPDAVLDYDKANFLLNTGINHVYMINSTSYVKTTVAFSGNGMKDQVFESSIPGPPPTSGGETETAPRLLNYDSDILTHFWRGAVMYSNKLNARNRIRVGSKYSLYLYDNLQTELKEDLATRYTLMEFDGAVGTLRNFVSWKYRLNNEVTMVAGFHNFNVLYNNKSTLEPRLALTWKPTPANVLSIGYGMHSTMERVHNYFTRIEQEDGSYTEPNKDLDVLKAHHMVLGYKRKVTENIAATVELYYQHLYNLPVENNDTSYYATINEGMDYRYVDLVNEGTGKNYGVELTLERYLSNNFYLLLNGTLYESTYETLEGVERNTQYNGNYLINVLVGKEFTRLGRKHNKTLSLDAKFFYGGGRKIIPLLRDENGDAAMDPLTGNYLNYGSAYEEGLDDVYHFTLSASYKVNRPNATHELFLCLNNPTNNRARIYEYYDADEPHSIGYFRQGAFWPNLMYRVYF